LPDVGIFRTNVSSLKGVFYAEDWKLKDKDTNIDYDIAYVLRDIRFLVEEISKKKGHIEKLTIIAGDQLLVFFRGSHILGIITLQNANVSLLDVMASVFLKQVMTESSPLRYREKRSSEIQPKPEELEIPKTLAREVVYLSQQSEEIFTQIPEYVRDILYLVDGTRTVREIIELSGRPPEVVLDVIITFLTNRVISFEKRT
jgi:hypothetical protein